MANFDLIDKIVVQFSSKRDKANLPEYLLVARTNSANWIKNPDSLFNCSDNKGFKYEIFMAEHPTNLQNNNKPHDLNVLSAVLASKGSEVYAYAYRTDKYKPIAALKAEART